MCSVNTSNLISNHIHVCIEQIVALAFGQVFVPPSSFEAASRCLWTDSGRSCLRWLCGYQVLQPDYGPSVQDFWNCVSMSIPFA